MKFCLSGHQSREYLKKADEVMINYSDHNFIYDLMTINPNVIVTLCILNNTEVNWDVLKQYKIICTNGFRIASDSSLILFEAKQKDYPFFSLIPARYGYQLNALIDFGVCAARISGQLTHDMNFLKDKVTIEKRIIPNITDSYLNYKPVLGSWIRPEEIEMLEGIIDVCEFQTENVKQERALYRIYAERKTWPGRLSEIINGIDDSEIMNSLLIPDFSKQRLYCRQSCMSGGSCHYCERICSTAKNQFVEKYLK